ncbi:alpha/beta hydrolase-fold protein [Maioricimonas sp. JC845]|uniref:alpha/beta hydrolase n=1 Tax=Maioricimonas sp. JC845 TaxID=3232138 RepID=UPI00345AC414
MTFRLTSCCLFLAGLAACRVTMAGPPASSSEPAAGGASAEVVRDSEVSPVTLPNTLQFDMRSHDGRVFRIFVARPTGEQPEHGWPVVYHTDGQRSFAVLVAAVEGQSRDHRPAVVVGIGYPEDDPAELRRRRTFDLTPPADREWLDTAARPFADLETGGCDRFLAFIVDELKPEIERRFPIDRRRQTLFGHSFGGLFTLHTLLTRPERFQTFVASSPSLWWNAGSLIEQERAFLHRFAGKELNARLLLTVGAEELSPPDRRERNKPPAFRARTDIGNASQVSQRLQAANIAGLQVEFRELPDAHHGSAELPAAALGMRFALSENAVDSRSRTESAGNETGQ